MFWEANRLRRKRPQQLRARASDEVQQAGQIHNRATNGVENEVRGNSFDGSVGIGSEFFRLSLIALLSLFAFVGQFLSKEINFERQPGKIRAVCNSE